MECTGLLKVWQILGCAYAEKFWGFFWKSLLHVSILEARLIFSRFAITLVNVHLSLNQSLQNYQSFGQVGRMEKTDI